MENILGVYISSNQIDSQGMVIVKYFLDLFTEKSFFRSPLKSPIIMLFDPELKNNKLDIKILNIYSVYYKECPLFSEMPYKFKLENLEASGLDVLFYNQEHYDTISILENKRDISQENIGDLIANQKILSNRNVMLQNLGKLIDKLDDCENYITRVIDKQEKADPEIGRLINKCLGQFSVEDMSLLETMVNQNFRNASVSNSLGKLQMAQIHLAEKINNVFAKSLNNYLIH